MGRYTMVIVLGLGLWVLVLTFLLLMSWGDMGRNGERLDSLMEEGDMLLDRVEMLGRSIMDRDSMLLMEIDRSEDEVMRYVRLRSESWVKAEALGDSIRRYREFRDSLLNRKLGW